MVIFSILTQQNRAFPSFPVVSKLTMTLPALDGPDPCFYILPVIYVPNHLVYYHLLQIPVDSVSFLKLIPLFSKKKKKKNHTHTHISVTARQMDEASPPGSVLLGGQTLDKLLSVILGAVPIDSLPLQRQVHYRQCLAYRGHPSLRVLLSHSRGTPPLGLL